MSGREKNKRWKMSHREQRKKIKMISLLFFTSYENNNNNNWMMRIKKVIRSAEFQNIEKKDYVTNALLRNSNIRLSLTFMHFFFSIFQFVFLSSSSSSLSIFQMVVNICDELFQNTFMFALKA